MQPNDQPNQAQKIFLIGSVVLGALVLVGLVWAVSLGPDGYSSKEETGLSFNDDNDPTTGPGDAKVVVRMFSDFQCPACAAAEGGLRHAMQTYGGRVRFVWNDFPLTAIHKNAKLAANAARCAEEQGKFWEFREQVFSFQSEWADKPAPSELFGTYAGKLGLNMDSFLVCLAKQTYDHKVSDDMAEGRSNRVNSTPTFFIGNKRFQGGMSNAEWDTEISALLDKAGS